MSSLHYVLSAFALCLCLLPTVQTRPQHDWVARGSARELLLLCAPAMIVLASPRRAVFLASTVLCGRVGGRCASLSIRTPELSFDLCQTLDRTDRSAIGGIGGSGVSRAASIDRLRDSLVSQVSLSRVSFARVLLRCTPCTGNRTRLVSKYKVVSIVLHVVLMDVLFSSMRHP